MSTINTNGINVNYPIPGVNNSSQGFRDNFASIKTNLDTAGSEISDLQNKVVLKQALANTTLNNDMANALISNTSTRNFRATSYNLGNALANTVAVDTTLADVFYGTVSANTSLTFSNWAPTGTERVIELQLAVSNANAFLSFPSTLTFSANSGATTLENVANVGGLVTVTVPNGVSSLNYRLSTLDCGTTLIIQPINRPKKSTQILERTPANVVSLGDVAGTMCADASYMYVCTANYDGTTNIWSTLSLYSTGSSSAVTQITSRTTGVTINKTSGAITLFSAAGTTSYQTFTVTNSTVAATDIIVVNQKSGTDKYEAYITHVTTGSFSITFATTGGTTTEQPVFTFAVIKGS